MNIKITEAIKPLVLLAAASQAKVVSPTNQDWYGVAIVINHCLAIQSQATYATAELKKLSLSYGDLQLS